MQPIIDGTCDVNGIDDAFVGPHEIDERVVVRTMLKPDIHGYLERATQECVVNRRMYTGDDASFDQTAQTSTGGIRAQPGGSSELPVTGTPVSGKVAEY